MGWKSREVENAWRKAWRKANPDKVKAAAWRRKQRDPVGEAALANARSKAYQKRNPEKSNLRNRLYRAANKDRVWKWELQVKLGMTPDKYNALLREQRGGCGICGRPETVKKCGKVLRLSVDHCHKRDRVRGLLCTKCNRGLGLFEDNELSLLRAITYLRKYKCADPRILAEMFRSLVAA